MNYLGRRLIRAIVLLVGVSALCFAFTQMAPGSFFDEMRLNPQVSPETIASLNEHYGLNQPLVVRYERWMRAAAHGDFGYSIAYNSPVAPLLWSQQKIRCCSPLWRCCWHGSLRCRWAYGLRPSGPHAR